MLIIQGGSDTKSAEWLMVLVLALVMTEPAWAQSLGMTSSPSIWESTVSYCESNGGTVVGGKCYFPDGGYCDLNAFYAGVCPSRADKEQAQWERGIRAFLYCDDPYCTNCDSSIYSTGAYGTGAYGTAIYWQAQADQQYALGSYQTAVDLYTRAVELDPTLILAWLNLGNSLYFLGDHERSLAAYDEVLKLDPQNANGLQGRSRDLQMLGRSG